MKQTALFHPLRNIYRAYQDQKQYRRWLKADKSIPPPHRVKQLVLKEYADHYHPRIFIETGTFLGDMVYALRQSFDQIYSIELSEELWARCNKRFAKQGHISIPHGDSGQVLPDLLSRIKAPCLFWLDGHYSAGITAKGNKETPILEELEYIFAHQIKDHTILIDDARLFTGQQGYPHLETVQDLVMKRDPSKIFEVHHDIIRIHHEHFNHRQ